MMPRPQFSLKTLLWLMVVVAAFFAGMRLEKSRQRLYSYGLEIPPIQTGRGRFK
jgi:hypothetical protein